MSSHSFGSEVLRFHFASLPSMRRDLWVSLTNRFGAPEALLECDSDELAEAGADRSAAREILAARETIEETAEAFEAFASAGIEVLYPDAPDLPARLRRNLSDWRFLTRLGASLPGDPDPLVGIVGRRDASEEGMEFAHELSREFGHRGVATLSGLARGIDTAAHLGSLAEGSCTTAAIPMGILRFLRGMESRFSPLSGGTRSGLCVLSGVAPCFPWSVSEAMRRNRWIAAWCDALVVVEAGPSGGTWKTASDARRFGRPIWAARGFSEAVQDLGNDRLARSVEANPLEIQEPVDRSVARILERVEEAASRGDLPPDRPRQRGVVPRGKSPDSESP